jgi:hypothetical protein
MRCDLEWSLKIDFGFLSPLGTSNTISDLRCLWLSIHLVQLSLALPICANKKDFGAGNFFHYQLLPLIGYKRLVKASIIDLYYVKSVSYSGLLTSKINNYAIDPGSINQLTRDACVDSPWPIAYARKSNLLEAYYPFVNPIESLASLLGHWLKNNDVGWWNRNRRWWVELIKIPISDSDSHPTRDRNNSASATSSHDLLTFRSQDFLCCCVLLTIDSWLLHHPLYCRPLNDDDSSVDDSSMQDINLEWSKRIDNFSDTIYANKRMPTINKKMHLDNRICIWQKQRRIVTIAVMTTKTRSHKRAWNIVAHQE